MMQLIAAGKNVGKTLASGILAERLNLAKTIHDDPPTYCRCDGIWAVWEPSSGETICLMCKREVQNG